MRRAKHIVVGVNDFSRRGWHGVMTVERACFKDDGIDWTRDNYEQALERGAYCVTADDGIVRAACWVLGNEIFSVGVAPDMRGRGLGKRILRYAMKRIRRHGHRRAFLYVEPKDVAAIRLYLSVNFKIVGFIDDYHGPGRGILHMERKL